MPAMTGRHESSYGSFAYLIARSDPARMPELDGVIKISRKIGLILGDYRVLLPDS